MFASKFLKYPACLMLLASFISINSYADSRCTIIGEVINRKSTVLLLQKCSDNINILHENPVEIPIEKGRFNFSFSYSDMEGYQLIFQDELETGSWRPIAFFPDTQVEFILHAGNEFDKNVIRGGALNAEYYAYQVKLRNLFEPKHIELSKIRQALRNDDDFETAEYKLVVQQLRATNPDDQDAKVPIYQKMDEMEKTRTKYTEKGKLFMDRQDSLKRASFSWKYEYMRSNPSLMAYYLMWMDVLMVIKNDSDVAKLVVDAFPFFEKKYPDHVYTTKIRAQLTGIQTIAPGNKYIDFKAPTLDGDTLHLSALIKNKIALIDMWGSWCGPCIAKSRLIVPIYNKYKGKGFEVVGIAREFKTTDAVKRRLAQEQFSWTNLVELDDKLGIWNKYGISNGSGIMVLVDRDGTILSVDPKPEELEKILQEKLGR